MTGKHTTNKAKHTSSNPLMRYAINNLHHTVRGLIPDEISTVLEVGVGEGFSTIDVLGNRNGIGSYGGDLNAAALVEAAARFPTMRYAVFNATRLPFANKSADLIYALEVLEHISQPENALREFCRVARDYVLISVPNEPVFRIQRLLSGKGLTMWGDHPEHVNHWSLRGIRHFLQSNGLSVLAATSPPPFAWSVVLCRVP